MDVKLREWGKISRDAELGTLRDLASDIWGTLGGRAQDAGPGREPDASGAQRAGILTPAEERTAMASGIARLQQSRSAWSRPELVRSIAQTCLTTPGPQIPPRAVSHLDQLADRGAGRRSGRGSAAGSTLPSTRASRTRCAARTARALYTAHGSARYATAGQLSMEKRILGRAQGEDRHARCAGSGRAVLGADLQSLDAQLRDAAQAAQDPNTLHTSAGLRPRPGHRCVPWP